MSKEISGVLLKAPSVEEIPLGLKGKLQNSEIVGEGRRSSELKIIDLGLGHYSLVVFNPLDVDRDEPIIFRTNSPSVSIITPDGQTVPFEAHYNPESDLTKSPSYLLIFRRTVPAMGFLTLFISKTSSSTPSALVPLRIYSATKEEGKLPSEVQVNDLSSLTTLQLFNGKSTLSLNALTGLPEILTIGEGSWIFHMEFIEYSSTGGAYLFRPTGSAAPIQFNRDKVKIFTSIGELSQRIHVELSSWLSFDLNLFAGLPHMEKLFEFVPVIDMSLYGNRNREIGVRLSLDNNLSKGEYLTDVNGWDFHLRRFDRSLPIQANFYPITSAAVVLSEKRNPIVSFLTTSAMAAGMTTNNQIEFILDRRLQNGASRAFFLT
jgi:hypothetical protein